MHDLIKSWLWSLALLGLILSACLGLPTTIGTVNEKLGAGLIPNQDTYPLSRFSDIPVPSRFQFDRSKSFIYESGSGSVKVGRLFFKGWASQKNVTTFFENEMVNNGWTLVRVIEHDGTMLLYQKKGRVCTVILGSSLGQSTVEIQIGPK